MKKTSIIFATISLFIGIAGTIAGTIYVVMYLGILAREIMADMSEMSEANVGGTVLYLVMFLVATIYAIMVMVTGLLTRKVIKDNVLDKIKPFGILSIIFFNPVGGIFTLVYDKQIKDELERTAPKVLTS